MERNKRSLFIFFSLYLLLFLLFTQNSFLSVVRVLLSCPKVKKRGLTPTYNRTKSRRYAGTIGSPSPPMKSRETIKPLLASGYAARKLRIATGSDGFDAVNFTSTGRGPESVSTIKSTSAPPEVRQYRMPFDRAARDENTAFSTLCPSRRS